MAIGIVDLYVAGIVVGLAAVLAIFLVKSVGVVRGVGARPSQPNGVTDDKAEDTEER